MKKPLFIIGYMGVGKTRIGKKISALLDAKFIDIDQKIEEQEGQTISKIFKTHGEAYFRDAESQFIKTFNFEDKCVISCGGGLPCHSDNLKIILEKSNSIYLSMDFEKINKKLKKGKNARPMISHLNDIEFYEKNKVLFNKRVQYYKKANFELVVNDNWKENFLKEIYPKL